MIMPEAVISAQALATARLQPMTAWSQTRTKKSESVRFRRFFFFFRVINLFSGHCCRRTWHRTRVGLGEDQLEIRPPCQEKINKKYPPTNFWSPQIFEHD